MNKTFDIKRFVNVVRCDGMSYFQNFGWTLAVLWGIPVGIWFICYMTANNTGEITEARYGFLQFLMIVAIILIPSRLYKNSNDSRKGIQFAMLPASSLEKFLSMIIYCLIVTPILYMFGAVAIDTIFTLIPGKNPYENYVINQIFNVNLIEVDFGDLEKLVMNLPFYQIFIILSCTSIFMFTNMLFKKRKVSKTIGILALLGIVFMVIIVKIGLYCDELYGGHDGIIPAEYGELAIRLIYYGYYVFNIILTSVMLYFTYCKIKKQTY